MSEHLVHIGFPKCGSTALTEWFERHPELTFVQGGLAGYYRAFDISTHAADARRGPTRWHVTSQESLSKPRLRDGPEVEALDEQPRDVPLPESRRRVRDLLHGLFPHATILIVTRGFHGALLSNYSQHLRSGGWRPAAELFTVDVSGWVEFLDYDGVVELYREAFGPDAVWVLPYELLRDDPEAFALEIESRMALDAHVPFGRPVNPALPAAALYWYPRLSRSVRRIPGRFGERVFSRWARLLNEDRLLPAVETVARIRPPRDAPPLELPDALIESFRGRARSLASLPHYDRYAAEYLND